MSLCQKPPLVSGPRGGRLFHAPWAVLGQAQRAYRAVRVRCDGWGAGRRRSGLGGTPAATRAAGSDGGTLPRGASVGSMRGVCVL